MDEIEETIKEKKSKWHYTPMRETDETEALIDQLLMEYSSGGVHSDTVQHNVPPKHREEPEFEEPYQPECYAESECSSESNEKTMVYSRDEINLAEKQAYETDSFEDDDEYESRYEDDDYTGSTLFDEFMDAEDDFDSCDTEFSLKSLVRTVAKIAVIAVIGGFCVTGVMTTLNSVLNRINFSSQTGAGPSAGNDSDNGNSKLNEEFKKVVYPIVAADVEDFNSADELSPESVLNAAVLENVMNSDASLYKDENSGDISIPEMKLLDTAERLFGPDAPYKTTGTEIGGITVRYNKSESCYVVSGESGGYAYTPEIADISQAETDTYSVLVNYKNSTGSKPDKKKMIIVKKSGEAYSFASVRTIPEGSPASESSEN